MAGSGARPRVSAGGQRGTRQSIMSGRVRKACAQRVLERDGGSIGILGVDRHRGEEGRGARICVCGFGPTDDWQPAGERLLDDQRKSLSGARQHQVIARPIESRERRARKTIEHPDIGQPPRARVERTPARESERDIGARAGEALEPPGSPSSPQSGRRRARPEIRPEARSGAARRQSRRLRMAA